MACLRYDPKTRTFYPIKYSQMNRSGSVIESPFREQVLRGYQRQEAKGAAIYGRPAGIKKIWENA